jgi:secreted trypsin-like serine protease
MCAPWEGFGLHNLGTYIMSCQSTSYHNAMSESLIILNIAMAKIILHKIIRVFTCAILLRSSTGYGKEVFQETKRNLIVGGSDAHKQSYPWFATAMTSDYLTNGCAGSLVTPEYVLTTANCSSQTFKYFAIGNYCSESHNCGQVFTLGEVATKYVNPGFSSATYEKNFGLVKLSSPVTNISPVKMDQGTISPNYVDGKLINHES